jgi:autotransporter-associated beta strand protein
VLAGDGGGGGGGGFNDFWVGINSVTSGGNFTASAGGAGGAGNGSGGGGGGGSGGLQIGFTINATFTISAGNQRIGGAGGAGGASGTGFGGNGGSGGNGALFNDGGTVVVGTGALLSGGAGGAGGVGGAGTGTNGNGGFGIEGSGLTITNNGTISGGLSGGGAQVSSIVFTGGNNFITFGNATSGLVGGVSVTGTLTFNQATNSDLDQVVSGTGSVIKTGAGLFILGGINTYAGGTTITAGTLQAANVDALGTGAVTLNGGRLQVGAPMFLTNAFKLNTAGGTLDSNNLIFGLSGVIADGNGPGALTKVGAGTLILSGANTYTGVTNINVGTLSLSGGLVSIASSAGVRLNGAGTTFAITNALGDVSIKSLSGVAGSTTLLGANRLVLTNASDTFAGIIQGTSGLTLNGGTEVLTGTNTYTGTTVVNGGTLQVDGSIAASSNVTVNSGGTLAGVGIVDPATTTIMSGGTLAPGNAANSTGTLAITGNLAFQSGAIYLVQVTPTAAASTSVSGSATLGGATVNANFANGSYVSKTYTILTAAGGRVGTFASLVNTNLPGGFKSSLSYDNNNAYLDLALSFVPPSGSGLSINQQNVGNAISNFFNSNGSIPIVFGSLTPGGLTQLSAEGATASQQTTFDAMNQFMGVLTDPFIAGRGDPVSAGGSATGYAEQSLSYAARGRSKSERDAYAAVYTKAPPVAATFEQRWSVWAAGYGGSQRTSGDPVALGTNNTSSSIYGTAVGADYRISPNTIAGFALAGGGTNFSVNTLGGGRSDLFQAGAFIRHNFGPAYITGALAYGWQDVTTNRTVTVAGLDQLRAEFNANAWSGRIESGYRFVSYGLGITPYAAGQFTTFDLPAYMEQATSGSNQFALAYNSKSVTDTRSELGIRTDKSLPMQNGIFTLRGRLAWAHDYDPDRNVLATFQTLPGASFIVNGATHAPDSALTTASLEWKWLNGWSAAATFEGEFSNVTQSYAGKGVVRYAW